MPEPVFGPVSPPPSEKEVAWRFLALLAVVKYGAAAMPAIMMADKIAAGSPEDQAKFAAETVAFRDEVWKPMRERLEWWNAFTSAEKVIAEKTIQGLSQQEVIDSIWKQESAGVLAWAMGLVALPDYDLQVDVEDLNVDFKGSLDAFVSSVTLRPAAEIEKARDLAELWHWRSRTRYLMENPRPEHKEGQLEEILEKVTIDVYLRGDFSTMPIDGDFPVKGKAYRDLDDAEWSEVRSITMERHLALNWLCGYAPGNAWDQTPTNT